MLKPAILAGLSGAMILAGTAIALEPAQKALLAHYAAAAPGDPARGEAFFYARHSGGKADSPSCTACHSGNLAGPGKTRAGKEIGPMAASVAPKRYTDLAEVEKWFRRNCADVLGRDCTAQEKSDVLAFLLSI